MWEYEPNDVYERRVKYYGKKHKRELAAVFENLETVREAINMGAKARRLPFGFLHFEPHGVLAIDQKGGGKDLAQTRLYIYLEEATETIHLITMGDKNSQTEDIEVCKDYVAGLRKKPEGADG